ncbi:hypothetical protein [Acinetobacter nosocomialis]|uniref:hypothetical protein n=1 Tax=Acinetobacter nosocomialis TaxID=106654 RepID=UPI001A9AD79D|nr:hypothetical protein [Acinetobacter nosocomialis]MBO1280312.1 hypothetical protein [Acinetobacter nosocomialis]
MSSGNFLKKVQTRDWIYLFIISFFLQFIIYYFSFIYGGSTKALGYISFAGTLISIILAVIAIGYTYGESIKQKGSSDQLLLEIASLREIKDKLAGQVDILENIAAIKSVVENTESVVKNMDLVKQLDKLQELHSINENNISPPEIGNDQIEKIIMSFEYISDLYIFEILNKIMNEGLYNIEDLIPDILKDHEDFDKSWILLANLYTSIYFICVSLGIIVGKQASSQVLDIYKRKYPKNRKYEKRREDLNILIDKILYVDGE